MIGIQMGEESEQGQRCDRKKKRKKVKMSVVAERYSFETVLFIGTEKISMKNALADVVVRGLRSIGIKVEETK
jgi:hypothetical protein